MHSNLNISRVRFFSTFTLQAIRYKQFVTSNSLQAIRYKQFVTSI